MEGEHHNTNIMTMTRHIIEEQRKYPESTGDFTLLLAAIQLGCKYVSNCVRKAGLVNLTGEAGGSTNTTGDTQKKLDVLSNEVFINALASSGRVSIMVSEENEHAIFVKEKEGAGKNQHKYAVVFDPLDGSSNIDAGVSIGTIFGIYKLSATSTGTTLEDVLRPGREMVAAGYAMYGSSTVLVLSTGHEVHGYTLDPSLGEFVLTHENIRIPPKGKIYSVNEGNAQFWDKPTADFVEGMKRPKKGSPCSLRYIGSMVADVHRTLLYGGVFMYPGDSKAPNGKLRVLYECFPMAFLTEKAGGRASTGKGAILDHVPKGIHERCPVFLGSKEDVEEIERLYTLQA